MDGKQHVVAIVQTRMGSTRLPGKVLEDANGKPLVWHAINRLKRVPSLSQTVLATTREAEDDVLERCAEEWGIPCFRGDQDDVLSRYQGAARAFDAQIVVRVTSDCPLIDSQVTEKVILEYLAAGCDYASNTLERTFPRGLDVEVFSCRALERAFQEAREPYQREHVTPYIWENADLFRLANVQAEGFLRRPELRLTVDTSEDLQLIREIYRRLDPGDGIFSIEDVIRLLDQHPELAGLNAHVEQKRIR